MPRAALILLAAALVSAWATAALALDAHVDPSLVPASCAACHKGHGVSQSPMLKEGQMQTCLSCHGSRGQLDRSILQGAVAPGARPSLLSSTLSQPFTHPIDGQAFSRHERGVITCTSCHSPHRSASDRAVPDDGRGRKTSTRDPSRFEFELCESCHGQQGSDTGRLSDSSRRLNPNNRSYHPVRGPAVESAGSLKRSLAGKEVNCTDCHGNSNPAGPKGPHGSAVPFILRAEYATADGNEESPVAYALCYSCHDREKVLDSASFPLHRTHVVDRRASCATCHDGHGAVNNRALIRFGEETFLSGVSPSAALGRLAFVSDGAGSGACYLTCHGYDHAPAVYGGHPEDLEAAAVAAGRERKRKGSWRPAPTSPRQKWREPRP